MNILARDEWFVDRYLRDIINDEDTFTLTRVDRFNDPLITVRGFLGTFKLLPGGVELRVEVSKLVG